MDKLTLPASGFALTTDTLDFIQNAYSALERLGLLGGNNYILSGCEVTGSAAASGYMFLDGKLMPFTGGTIQPNVRIIETPTLITVGAASRTETVYHAEFGTSTNPSENFVWDDLNNNRLMSIKDLSAIREVVVNIGAWDFTSTLSKEVLIAGITLAKIVSIQVVVRNDAGNAMYDMRAGDGWTSQVAFGTYYFGNAGLGVAQGVRMVINPASFAGQNPSLFSNTGINRGFIVVKYLR